MKGVITRIGFVTWADALPDIGHPDAVVFRLVYLIFCRGWSVGYPGLAELRVMGAAASRWGGTALAARAAHTV